MRNLKQTRATARRIARQEAADAGLSRDHFNPNGFVLFDGPSRIDGERIVVIATGFIRPSDNSKVGPSVQTWILRADRDPVRAIKDRVDSTQCGACVHRGDLRTGKGRTCYVNVGQAPLAVWRCWERGGYAACPFGELPSLFDGVFVRLGAYGDPAAAPTNLWRVITESAEAHTGYTHQWKSARLRDTLEFCQLSADSCGDAERAAELGVGSFRVRPVDPSHPDHALQPGEVVCPASDEGAGDATCAACRMCDGASGKRIAILAHGATSASYHGDHATRKAILSASAA